jgi:hypothetical protein
MKKILLTLLFLCSNVYAWDSSSAYNTIAMSYTANTTITQVINLDSTQKAATTINFKVDVKNGGGRPTHDLNGNPLAYSSQTDTAVITIHRYNSSGVLLGSTVSQTYVLKNLGSDPGNGFSTAPGDNKHPFTQANITYSGSLADTAYIKVEMKGTDGAWWAGNYGAQWRTPTVTVGGDTANIVYNSEFGVAPNGVKAQGWTPSYGSWAACGVTSGNSTCVTQQQGVTANMWGGGYDANGGTTSGQAGGYDGTLTSDNATQAASGSITPGPTEPAAPAGPTVEGGTITQNNAPSNQTLQSGSSYVNNSDRTAQQTRINTWANSTVVYQNAIYIDQIGGNNNNVNVNVTGTKNRVELTLDGAGTNTVGITQVGSNYLKADVNGYQNSLTSSQTNTISTNYAETTVNGNNNTVNHTQSNNNNRLLFSTVNGNNNTLTTTQSGGGQHYLDARLTGNGHNVSVNQYGANANNARIDVTNAGGSATVDLEQAGGKSFTLIQSCTNPLGCSTVVKQQ